MGLGEESAGPTAVPPLFPEQLQSVLDCVHDTKWVRHK